MEPITRFVHINPEDDYNKLPQVALPLIYTPNESLSEILINGRRIQNVFWKDSISQYSFARKITFDWWQEDKPAPAAQQPDLFTQNK